MNSELCMKVYMISTLHSFQQISVLHVSHTILTIEHDNNRVILKDTQKKKQSECKSLNECFVNYILLFAVVWEPLHGVQGSLIVELIELYIPNDKGQKRHGGPDSNLNAMYVPCKYESETVWPLVCDINTLLYANNDLFYSKSFLSGLTSIERKTGGCFVF